MLTFRRSVGKKIIIQHHDDTPPEMAVKELFLNEENNNSPLQPLPHEASMRIAIRRNIRLRRQAGTLLEDLGVHSGHRQFTTRDDLLRKKRRSYPCRW